MKNYERIFVWGDAHGDWDALPKFIRKFGITKSLIIQVGDFGLGFQPNFVDFKNLRDLAAELEPYDCDLWAIRGNHDNPIAYQKDSFYNNSRITLIPDYTTKVIHGKKFLFVGGAISVDRKVRVPDIDFWHGERFKLIENYQDLEKCDVLITHSAPLESFPANSYERILGWLTHDAHLRGELEEERKDISTLFHTVEPKFHCYGHYHLSNYEFNRGCVCKCLDIDEFWELPI